MMRRRVSWMAGMIMTPNTSRTDVTYDYLPSDIFKLARFEFKAHTAFWSAATETRTITAGMKAAWTG
jgi:hypothetical protein